MKTLLHTLIALLMLLLNTGSYSADKCMKKSCKINSGSMIPVSARDWNDAATEIPENLKYVKAKFARVSVAEFVWGSPDETVPADLMKAVVPVAAKVWDDSTVEVPEELSNIKAKYALVPVPSKNFQHYTLDENIPLIEEIR